MNVADEQTQSTPRRQLSVLIVQMGEIEEIFRSLMALKAIKHLYPEVQIHFITRKEVSAPLKRVDWLTSVVETPSFKSKDAGDPIQKVALWIDQVIHQHYDIMVNWTMSARHARMAAVATSLIPAMVKLGDYVREDLTLGSYDAWSMYRQAWVGREVEQDIHHTDIITTQLLTALQIHAGDPTPDAGVSAVTSRYFFKANPTSAPMLWVGRVKNSKWIAIHAQSLGSRGAELTEMILRRHPDAGIVLIGEEECDWEVEVNPRVINLTKTLHLDSLIQVLSQCTWIVSGPSPVADLASLMNIRCLYIPRPLKNAHSLKWTETAPYGNGHVVVTSIEEWKPELAYAAWSHYQSEWFHHGSIDVRDHFESLGVGSGWNEVQVYKSRIRPPAEGGGVCFERSTKEPNTFENWMFRVRGQMARAWFCGWLPSVETEVARIKLNPSLIKRIREVKDSAQVLSKIVLEGQGYARALMLGSESIKSNHLMSIEDRALVEEQSKKLMEVEALISRVVNVEPELTCMLQWYQQLMHNLMGSSIHEMARETIHVFDLVTEGLELVEMYAQKTIELARPKAVAQEITPTLQSV